MTLAFVGSNPAIPANNKRGNKVAPLIVVLSIDVLNFRSEGMADLRKVFFGLAELTLL